MDAKLLLQSAESEHMNLYGTVAMRALLLLTGAVLVTACQFTPARRATPTETPSAPSGSIGGRIWLDECLTEGVCPTLTPETTQNTSDAPSATVRGLAGLEVSIGQGPCPSYGFGSQRTGPNGAFNFPDLQPGFYCVTAYAGEAMGGRWLQPEALESDRSTAYTLALGPGEERQDLQFIWGPGAQEPPSVVTPTATPEPACTNRFSLVEDVTIEDGQRVDPGANIKKVWRIRNEGTCTWSSAYAWVFVSGYQLGAVDSLQIPAVVAPGVMMDLSVDVQAPAVAGTYRSYWMMRSPAGELFGTGPAFNEPVWVEIEVGPEPTPVITEWKGEYFANRTLQGAPDLVRNDKNVDFDWDRGAPAAGLPNDNFSARWTRTLNFDAAVYRFSVASDDGVRLWVDDRLVIDEWSDSASNRNSVDLAMVSGKHTIRVEYYERSGDAEIKLSWKKVTLDDGSQWVGRFWFNRERDSKWALVETAAEIDFNWGSESPALGIPADEFSASWTRSIDFEAGRYRFSGRSDDGMRFYLDDQLLIDEWHNASASETYSVEREISGTHQLQVMYYEARGNARIEFGWVRIGPPNQAPVAQSDGYETTVDTALNVLDPGVLENDSDPEGDELFAVEVTGPTHGELVLHDNGAFSYRPDTGYAGEDSFVYRASDGFLESEDTTVRITIQSEDQLPAAVDDLVETQEDTSVSIAVLNNDRGLGDTPIQIVSVGAPSHGNAVIENTSIVYTPDLDYFGVDSFTYTIADSDGDQSSAIVTVNILAVNDAPLASPDSYQLNEDESLILPDPGVLENDHDPEGSTLSASLQEDVQHGTLLLNADGSFSYVPDEDYAGADQFSYTVSDGSQSSQPAVVTLTIHPVEDSPTAVEDSYEVLFEETLVVDAPGLLANDVDPDGEALTAFLDRGPAHGTLILNADGSFEFTPETGYSGPDSFTYWVEDGTDRSASVTASLQILPPA